MTAQNTTQDKTMNDNEFMDWLAGTSSKNAPVFNLKTRTISKQARDKFKGSRFEGSNLDKSHINSDIYNTYYTCEAVRNYIDGIMTEYGVTIVQDTSRDSEDSEQ